MREHLINAVAGLLIAVLLILGVYGCVAGQLRYIADPGNKTGVGRVWPVTRGGVP